MLSRGLVLLACLLAGCSRPSPTVAEAPGGALFHDAAAETGLVFQHFNGATGEYYMPEIVGPGVALFDFDGDGDLDAFLIQGDFLEPGHRLSDAQYPLPPGWKPGCKLFRNDLIPSGKLHFTDVTEASGIRFPGMGMGAAVADYDNDGRPDLLITGFGRVALYHNEGRGTFTDVTHQAGIEAAGWQTSASFVDYDRDGKVDLFISHYVEFIFRKKQCHAAGDELDYCAPENFHPSPSQLYHNEGAGRFRDVSHASGIASARGPGLGVLAADLLADGWPSLYVANDSAASYFWRNRHNGTFVESGLESGTAFDMDGKAQAGMGVAAGDFDNDGDEDLFKTNLTKQGANLYRNDGKGQFSDEGGPLGVLRATAPSTGFGAGWFDYDNDGWIDLAIANGAVFVVEAQRGQPFPYRHASQVLHNERGRTFTDVTIRTGPDLQREDVSRGLAFGDVNNDGRIDFVIANNNGPTRLYLNRTPTPGHWLQIKLEGVQSSRDGTGSYITVKRSDGITLRRRAHTDGSYLSASDGRAHFGLGAATGAVSISVDWLGGVREEYRVTELDRTVTLRQGSGTR